MAEPWPLFLPSSCVCAMMGFTGGGGASDIRPYHIAARTGRRRVSNNIIIIIAAEAELLRMNCTTPSVAREGTGVGSFVMKCAYRKSDDSVWENYISSSDCAACCCACGDVAVLPNCESDCWLFCVVVVQLITVCCRWTHNRPTPPPQHNASQYTKTLGGGRV